MMIVREPPPSRMRKLRAKINVRPKPRAEHTPEAPEAPDEKDSSQEDSSQEDSSQDEASALDDDERLAEALRGTFPASDPPASWAG